MGSSYKIVSEKLCALLDESGLHHVDQEMMEDDILVAPGEDFEHGYRLSEILQLILQRNT